MESNKRLYVGSLPYITTEGELLKLFVQEGKVIDVVLMLDDHRRSKGQGFVEFENLEDAIRAQDRFHNYTIGDRRIIVDFAKANPLETEEGRQKYEDALRRRGPRFESFDRRLERKQGRKFGPEAKKAAKTFSVFGDAPSFGGFSSANRVRHPDRPQGSAGFKPFRSAHGSRSTSEGGYQKRRSFGSGVKPRVTNRPFKRSR